MPVEEGSMRKQQVWMFWGRTSVDVFEELNRTMSLDLEIRVEMIWHEVGHIYNKGLGGP